MLYNKSVKVLKKECELICLLLIILEFLHNHNIKQEFNTNSYELDGTFIFDIELSVTPHICPKCGEITKHIKDYRIRTVKFGKVQRGS